LFAVRAIALLPIANHVGKYDVLAVAVPVVIHKVLFHNPNPYIKFARLSAALSH
jgi:hypothetical protein